ncbi:MAG: hypothetical protein R3F16_06960 [Myxococcota bacterium]
MGDADRPEHRHQETRDRVRAPVWAGSRGLIALFVLAVVRHLGEERRFAELVEHRRPG